METATAVNEGIFDIIAEVTKHRRERNIYMQVGEALAKVSNNELQQIIDEHTTLNTIFTYRRTIAQLVITNVTRQPI